MKNYYRVMLGRKSVFAPECIAGGFIGGDYGIQQDLTGQLPEVWKAFNRQFIPIFLATHPDKTKVAAGLACGNLWTLAKGINREDVVLCPDGEGHYHVGDVTGDYFYQPGGSLPHRRPVQWAKQTIARTDMSEALRRSAGAASMVCNLGVYGDEIEHLIAGAYAPRLISTDETVEDPAEFVMEKHLEDFLVQNWAQTELGKGYVVYEVDGERVGQQYQTDTGPIDILAISKDKKTLLVVELKKGRGSDVVVGQLLRYMGYVKEELAEEGQGVKGVIIALENDPKMRRALSIVPGIDFYHYEIRFKLVKD